jgi:HAD superfamily phosphoserine phosphatase-like hydrolase
MNVFDFDNTIYDGESFVDLFKMMLGRDASVLRHIPRMISGVTQYKVGSLRLEEGMARYSKYVEQYLAKLPDMESIVMEFWDNNIHKIKPFYEDVRSEDDVIVSASPEMVIGEICRRIGIKHYIASQVNPVTGQIVNMCFRENKVKAFRKVYPNVTIDCLYTDSMHDKPLMDISNHVFMVKGNNYTQIK